MAIHQYLSKHSQYADYRCIYAIKNHKQKKLKIENARIIEYFSIAYFFYLARSKYWIANCKLPKYVLKKDSQVYCGEKCFRESRKRKSKECMADLRN